MAALGWRRYSPLPAPRTLRGMEITPAQAAPQTRTAAPLRVFVVEDSPLIRDRLQAMIALAGAVPAGDASGAASAIDAILAKRPEIVLLDVQLAEGGGFDVLRALHAHAPEIDVVMLSNFSADAYRQLAEKLGARAFLDKSREFDCVRELIAKRANRGPSAEPIH